MAKKNSIHQEEFEKLCQLQCTQEDICNFFNVSVETLRTWCKKTYGCTFKEIFSQKREGGRVSLRATQFRLAQNSPAMAIWLGKQYLEQRDVKAIEVTGDTIADKVEFTFVR